DRAYLLNQGRVQLVPQVTQVADADPVHGEAEDDVRPALRPFGAIVIAGYAREVDPLDVPGPRRIHHHRPALHRAHIVMVGVLVADGHDVRRLLYGAVGDAAAAGVRVGYHLHPAFRGNQERGMP